MATEQLKIVLTAETKQAQKQLEDFIKTTQGVSKVMPQVAKSVGGANVALVNFGRVVQDAPFGLIGIANNIDPLIGSFQSLKAETGSASAAFKALGGALIGPAGIAIAVSALTSAFIAFGPQIKGFLFATKELSEEQKKLNKEISEEQARLQVLSAVLQSNNTTTGQKKTALQELRKEYGPYLKDLTDEEILTTKTEAAIRLAASAILARAAARAKEAKIAENANKLLTLETEIAGLQQNVAQAEKTFNSLANTTSKAVLASEAYATRTQQALQRLNENKASLKALTDQQSALNAENAKYANDIAPKYEEALTKPPPKLKENTKAVIADTHALEARNKAIREAKDLLAVAEQAFFIQQGQDNTPIQAAPLIDEGPIKSLQEILQGTNVGELVKQFQDAKKAADELNASIQNLAVEAIAQLAANIGEAIITGDFKDVFRNFLGIIGSGLQEIGKKMIALSPIIAKLKLALATLNPALLLPAGIALVAIGAALRATVNKGVGARATGGPVTGSTPYLVGERGPELFVPGSSGRIVSNNNLSGGGGQLVARVSGSDLLFVLNKAQANRGAF